MERFEIKTSIFFGEGALKQLRDNPGKRFFLVTDPFMVKSGAIKLVTEPIGTRELFIFDRVEPDPSLNLVTEGVKECLSFQPDAVIALGGGSAIDEAKAILFFAKKTGQLPGDIPLTAIPTTSGTGSEVTSFAVVTDHAKGVKYPLVDPSLIPHQAILDVDLVKTVPPGVTADTGLDVLTHALEAYVSTKSTLFSDALAEKAALAVFSHLPRAFDNGGDLTAREILHHASCMAGLAFDKASLGLCHAIAHNVGGRLKVPHGRANAILLPHVIAFNAGLTDYGQKSYPPSAEKYSRIAALSGFSGTTVRQGVKNLIREIEKLQIRLSMPTGFQDCGVSHDLYEKALPSIVDGAMKDACILTNPRLTTPPDIQAILKKAFNPRRGAL